MIVRKHGCGKYFHNTVGTDCVNQGILRDIQVVIPVCESELEARKIKAYGQRKYKERSGYKPVRRALFVFHDIYIGYRGLILNRKA